ncbi:triose-phosphate isomerase [Myxococcota bacterium]|nr:triose-phosphate isomerase [Myxococcota bacterium]MBU1432521.1 triose-phosphate isomerase [Myxococcota bacterium]MBU1898093.1 triose-phosphate isomerase [Myxococcota bacterium]
MRKPIMAGNWKMNLSVVEGLALAAELAEACQGVEGVDVVIAPTATSLYPIGQALKGTNIALAAQNCHPAPQGAFTGELAPPMLAEVGCRYVIIGHSERRQFFGETDEGVGEKARSLIDHGLIPIICLGETLEEREAGETMRVVKRQLKAGLARLSGEEVAEAVIAYEPVWAIGTGRTATPSQAQEVHAALRQEIAHLFDQAIADRARIQYGGSVKPSNVRELMSQPDIDGALVGGASLKADSFAQIVGF